MVCGFFSIVETGSTIAYFVTTPPGTPAGASPNWITINFGSTPSAPTDSYMYSCSMGAVSGTNRSQIAMYQVVEQ